MPSLRRRLLVSIGIAMSLILIASSAAIYAMVRASLYREFDDSLVLRARSLATLTEFDHGILLVEFDPVQMPEFRRKERPAFYQVRTITGLTTRSPSMEGADLPVPDVAGERPVFAEMALPGGAPGRGVAIRLRTRVDEDSARGDSGTPAILMVARDTLDLDRSLFGLLSLLAGVTLVSTVVSLIVARVAIVRGLRPAEAIAGSIATVGHRDLGERLVPEGAPTELRPIVEKLNELLARLQSTFERERAFTGNVAHELRTPIAGLQAALDVAISRPREAAEYRRTLLQCKSVTDRMQRMVESLLSLVRSEAGALKLEPESFRLACICEQALSELSARADARDLRIQTHVEPAIVVLADRALATGIVTNLLDNAVSHASAGTTITVELLLVGSEATLLVVNDAQPLSNDDVEHIFDPFWRKDPARSGAGQHCGLGLSLAKSLSQAMGGSLSVSSAPDGKFTVRVVFPSASRATAVQHTSSRTASAT